MATKLRLILLAFALALNACAPAARPAAATHPWLTDPALAALHSVQLLDPYPLLSMRYAGAYPETFPPLSREPAPGFGCSLFAALADPESRVMGRNFDWTFSPALLLRTEPPDGFASISVVDIAYLGYTGSDAAALPDAPLAERQALLRAINMPFDGMNEAGLAIGMAAVSPGMNTPDPAKPTTGSLAIMRMVLDQAANVDEAVAIFQRYNIDMEGGPPLHYLIADAGGQAVLLEYAGGQTHLIPMETSWLVATNFLVVETGGQTGGRCWRYDLVQARLRNAGGSLLPADGLALLREVSVGDTQWSVVYDLSNRQAHIVMGVDGMVHTVDLTD